MYRNEVARLDQVDDELEFFLAAVAADVNGRAGAVFIDDVSLAAEEVIDHAVDGLLVAGNDSAGEDYCVTFLDLGVLVIVDGGAREGGHGLALGAADQYADFFRREILHLAGIDDEAFGNFDVSEVFGDLGGVVHRAADDSFFSSVLVREIYGEADAVDRTTEAGD